MLVSFNRLRWISLFFVAQANMACEEADPDARGLLRSIETSEGSLRPAFTPQKLAYSVTFDGVTTAEITVTPVDPDTEVTIDDVKGTTARVRAPLGKSKVTIVAELGEQREVYSLELDRTGDFVAEDPIAPEDYPPLGEEPEFGTSFGYGYPIISPDGRFVAATFHDFYNTNRFVDVYRVDGVELTREVRIDGYALAFGFCDRDPSCLWTHDSLVDQPEAIQSVRRGDGEWSERSASWAYPVDSSIALLSVDGPLAAFRYDTVANTTSLVSLLENGKFESGPLLPGLDASGRMGFHVTTKDRKRIVHSIVSGDVEQGHEPHGSIVVLENGSAGWKRLQRLEPTEPIEGMRYGSSMLVSDDGKWLYVGNSWKTVDGLREAGEVELFEWKGSGYELSKTFHQPTPTAYTGFGGLLRGDANTGEVIATGAVVVDSVAVSTLVFRLDRPSDSPSIEHPGGYLGISRDGTIAVGVALGKTPDEPSSLRIYR